MIRIGQYNRLPVDHLAPHGAYLKAGEDDATILMPAKYFPDGKEPEIGQEIDVFVYPDTSDKLVATTEHPFALAGEFAFLQVAEVNSVGAFLDWGLPAKQLLVPFSQQKANMRQGGVYLVYVYLDQASQRIVASQKVERFIGNAYPDYKRGQKVTALVCERTPIGYKCIVDNRHWGMIYQNEVFAPIELEYPVEAYVKAVRPDGKIDLTIGPKMELRTEALSEKIMNVLKSGNGTLALTDSSSPEDIKKQFGCSKKDFKRALGNLYKERLINIKEDGIELIQK